MSKNKSKLRIQRSGCCTKCNAHANDTVVLYCCKKCKKFFCSSHIIGAEQKCEECFEREILVK